MNEKKVNKLQNKKIHVAMHGYCMNTPLTEKESIYH